MTAGGRAAAALLLAGILAGAWLLLDGGEEARPIAGAPPPAAAAPPAPSEGRALAPVDLFGFGGEGPAGRRSGPGGPGARSGEGEGGGAGSGAGVTGAAPGAGGAALPTGAAAEEGAAAPPVPRGAVAGTVHGRLGEPAGGITLEARTLPRWEKAGEARADGAGRFSLAGLPAGVVVLERSGGAAGRRGESLLTVEVPADGAAEVALGGPVTLEGRSARPDGRPAAFVAAVPMESLSDPLASIGDLIALRIAGIRVVFPGEDGAFGFEGLPPGEWLVGNELSFEVIRLREGTEGPVRLDLPPRFLAGRILPEAPLDPARTAVTAIPAGALEAALRGDRRRMLDVVLAAWRGQPFDLPATGEFLLLAPGEGRFSLFVHAPGAAAEGPAAAEAQEGTLPGTATIPLHPAARVLVTVPDPSAGEYAAVAARDEAGAVAAFRAAPLPVEMALPAGLWRLEILRGGGRRFTREVVVPASGEVTLAVPAEGE